jgi:hypothetical protein
MGSSFLFLTGPKPFFFSWEEVKEAGNWACWLVAIIPAILEAEEGGSQVRGLAGQN